MDHSEYAVELFKRGYNCAQAVAVAFCDVTKMTEEEAAAISSSFGGGFGRMREVCGAVSGGCIVLGHLFGRYTPEDGSEAKAKHYGLIREFMEKFREANGSFICRELTGITEPGGHPAPRTEEFYKKRPCSEMVRSAAEILDEMINR